MTKWLHNPIFHRKFHAWAAIISLAFSPVAVVLLKDSVPYLVFISQYAVVVSHFSAWQASRVEVKQDEDRDES